MAEVNTRKYSKSASEGDLADVEEGMAVDVATDVSDLLIDGSKVNRFHSGFFTLPRLMSGRKRVRKKKTKEILQTSSKLEPEPTTVRKSKKEEEKKVCCKNDKQSRGFLKRLFRRQLSQLAIPSNISITTSSTHACDFETETTKNSKLKHVYASNTDIRSQHSACDLGTTAASELPESLVKDKIPAVSGIHNHGNTCFMNAIIQCLSNTDMFAEYFVMNHYRVDLLRRNKIHAKIYGTKGEVTEQLGVLLKSIWSCQYLPEVSNKFKSIVSKYGTQYEGSNQHDAQEFLLWLLDKVHEDLNTATKKRYKKPKQNSHGRTDEVVAAETLANYSRCNSSFVLDWFQGQFRSSLICSNCQKQSNTFDPYLCLSLPIPHQQTRPVFVNLVRLKGDPRQIKLGVSMDIQATVKELRVHLSKKHQIPNNQIILIEVQDDGSHQIFSDEDSISSIDQNQEVYAIEVPALKLTTKCGGEHLLLLWTNRIGTGSWGRTFGSPYVIQISRESTFKEIQKQILLGMSNILQNGVSLENIGIVLRLRVIGGIPGKCYLPSDVDHPLYMPTVDHALDTSKVTPLTGPQHLKLVIEWDQETKEEMISDVEVLMEIDTSVQKLRNQQKQMPKATLDNCFQHYFKEEKLGADNAWMCPSCHRSQPGMKQLSLWSCPDYFIIHLKRFRQSSSQRTKITSLVEFPVSGLDMTPYIAQRNHTLIPTHPNGLWTWSPWKRPRTQNFTHPDDNVYELYAVCNHHGNMQSGHYTGYCRNPVDGKWYMFDDTKVTVIQESEIVTPDAYILFYQRTNFTSSSCASSSTSGYSTASSASLINTDHWAYRMPPFRYLPPKNSKSQDNLCDIDSSFDTTSLQHKEPFQRDQRRYASMIPLTSPRKNSLVVNTETDRHSDEEVLKEELIRSEINGKSEKSAFPGNVVFRVTAV
ncbi:ubiquitin carboxyl-terminal hydrolase 31-like [Tachypleus tridentatus]|uniref:ubiquitin carboxyl-terminal hydrolase 31-like n=1 Tax=Tachypleus tridentatus TaxID=6853 RepID=UPI003FD2362F